MKIFILLIFIIIELNCFSQTNAAFPGLILIKPNYTHTQTYQYGKNWSDTCTINFYKSSHSSEIDKTIQLFYRHLTKDTLVNPTKYFSKSPDIGYNGFSMDSNSWLQPMSIGEMTNFMLFSCKKKIGNWYEIIINEKTNETLWIKGNKYIKFYNWENVYNKKLYLTIEQNMNQNVLIFSSNDTLSKKVDNNFYCFEIIGIDGNWMKISNTISDKCPIKDKEIEGWILFKDENHLYIKLKIE
jgi:hypothetical protein